MRTDLLVAFLAICAELAQTCGLHGEIRTNSTWSKPITKHEHKYQKVVLQNVRVFDGIHLHGHRDVVIEDGVFGTDYENADEIIDGQGRVVIPGLIDSHTHVTEPLHVEQQSSYGITTVMNMNCFNYTMCHEFKRAVGVTSVVTAGLPAIAPGAYHTKSTPIQSDQLVRDLNDVDEFVSWAVGNGSDFLKIVSETEGPSLEMQQALVKRAHRSGIPAATHGAFQDAFIQAIQSKTDHLQHLGADAVLAEHWIRTMIKQGQSVTPTMSLFRYTIAHPAVLLALHGSNTTNQTYEFVQENVRNFHRSGVTILAGTDSIGRMSGFDLPHGLSLHHELTNLVEAGLAPAEALRAATSIPAKVQGLTDRGVIAPGKRADMILLNSDPFVNITNTRDIARVWIGGLEYKDVAKLSA